MAVIKKNIFRCFNNNRLSLALIILMLSSCVCNEDRYEIVMSSNQEPLLIDKQEGTIWLYDYDEWVNLGTPPKEIPNKGDKMKSEY